MVSITVSMKRILPQRLLKKNNRYEVNIIIPNKVELNELTYHVTSIGMYAFYENATR